MFKFNISGDELDCQFAIVNSTSGVGQLIAEMLLGYVLYIYLLQHNLAPLGLGVSSRNNTHTVLAIA